MNSLVILMFIGLSFFMLFLFFYILKIEKILEQKLALIEMSIEESNKEIYLLKKKIKSLNEINDLEKLENIINQIVEDVKYLEEKNRNFYKEIEEEIIKIKNYVKKSPLKNLESINKNQELQILNLYKNGYSIEEISKELMVPVGEIEFIIKMAKLPKT